MIKSNRYGIDKKIIRWLHLSDFHTGKDGYGQRKLFKYILAHVSGRVASGSAPDLVFITGDIANKGFDQEYKEFNEQFFIPLLNCLPSDSQERIFIVPGNHDVDRNQARAVQTRDILLRVPEFLDPTDKGQFERQAIYPRFKAYIENDLIFKDDHWLSSAEGNFQEAVEIQGIRLGIVGVNTAWLSYGDDDRHNLSAGKSLLEDGLEAIKNCDIKIVLSHHPIDWFLDTELESVRTILGRYAALYLHGHMHKGRARYEEGGGYPFLTLQSGAGFQARENDIWVNRFLWCELDLTTRDLSIEPLKWSLDHQTWVTDGYAFPPRYQQGDRYILPLPSPSPLQPNIKKMEAQADIRGNMIDDDLITEIEAQRNLMIAVATGGPKIDEVNKQYTDRRKLIAAELRGRGIEDPNPDGDLWAWYGRWSSGDMSSWASRRVYVSKMYQPLIDQIQSGPIDLRKGNVSMPASEHPHNLNEIQLHVLRCIRTSPSRVSVRKISEILLYSKDDVTSALQVLVNEKFVRQDDRDKVSWNNEQATYFTLPTMRENIDNLLQNTDSAFPRALSAFLCHSSNDKPAVRDLYRRLIADQIDPWLDEEKLLPGQDWRHEIFKAVRAADVVIVCLSRGSIDKAGFVQKEIKYALDVADEQPEGAIFLIPLKLEECEVPVRLSNWQWVNYFEDNGHSKLIKALRARAQSLGIERLPEEL